MKKKKILFLIITMLLVVLTNWKEVKAESRNVFNDGTQTRYYPNSSYNTINFNQWNTITTNNSMYGIIFRLDSNGQDHFEAGQYLFDFYIETNNLTNHLASCNGINADFSFYDLTTNAWVSAANRSKSACIDSYYTTIGGNRTIHYLFSWTVNNSSNYDALFTQMKFDIYNYTGAGFVDYNGAYMIILGTLQDYDANIVQNFTNVAEQQRLNQQVILNATQNAQNIINNQNQNTQDILNSQTTINQNINNIGQDTSTIINQQQQNHQETMNADYTGTTEQPNMTDYNTYETNEETLLNVANGMNLNSIAVGIDGTSSTKIWEIITRLFQSNSIVFTMLLSILSVGVIKLMLNR